MPDLEDVQKTSIGPLLTRSNRNDIMAFAVSSFLKEQRSLSGFPIEYVHSPVIARTKIYDEAVSSFILDNPTATIVNLGCGFCTRYFRLASTTQITWVDVDFQPVLDLKCKFLKAYAPPLPRYHMVALDISKVEKVHDLGADLIIAEGSLPYVEEIDAKKLLKGRAIVDFIGQKRKDISKPILWRYNPENWKHLNIINSWLYDVGETRESIILEIDQRGLATS